MVSKFDDIFKSFFKTKKKYDDYNKYTPNSAVQLYYVMHSLFRMLILFCFCLLMHVAVLLAITLLKVF